MRRLWFLALAFIACSPARSPTDSTDAPVPLCGNGVLDLTGAGLDGLAREQCDDGPLNGTPQSYCSKQCFTSVVLEPIRETPVKLGSIAKRAVGLMLADNNQTSKGALAFTAYDDTGIHLIQPFDPPYNGTAPDVTLKVSSAPVALAAVGVAQASKPTPHMAPLWIEGPTAQDPTFHMYYADIDSGGELNTYEIPYPFPDSSHPQLFSGYAALNAIVVDQSSQPSHDLLVASVIVRSSTDVVEATGRFTAKGNTFGHTSVAGGPDFILGKVTQQITQFYSDSGAFQVVDVTVPGVPPNPDTFAVNGEYTVAMFADGIWPRTVVDQIEWFKAGGACFVDGGYVWGAPQFTHPFPSIVIDESGATTQYQFVGTPDEIGPPVFAQLPPGSRLLTVFVNPEMLLAVDPQGDLIYIGDGDCSTLDSMGSKPEVFPGQYQPWAYIDSSDTYVEGTPVSGFSLDDVFWATGW